MNIFQTSLKCCVGLVLFMGVLLGDSKAFKVRVDKSLTPPFLNVLSLAFKQDMRKEIVFVFTKSNKLSKKVLCDFDAFLLPETLMSGMPKKALSNKEFLFQSKESKTLYAFSLIDSQYCSKGGNYRHELERLEHWFVQKVPELAESHRVDYKSQYDKTQTNIKNER
ncbi:hypothetical protein JP0119_13430 [Helicobacter pylori]|uniref:hypothetical protein n=1 Tax=Helicobacter pylori TaxID=210 RepID=UPI00026AA3AE|nr:hypothetical protein [Helicobacter pylori]EJB23690.1 hypothetical protein HPCPY6311_1091 [Helicobacter pylori CPY6311]BAW61276.1 uncharacterized protein HPF70_1006 [Helicobacter pylori]BAW61604.1 uncharacterized protein HPF70_1338 [Helicobacter pylori]GHS10334.1 hypothetical protein JP0115_12220 [Helicobacter pylori]GHS28663.1 hypothetical protein JP0119_13430 [Helicobacter pylori]